MTKMGTKMGANFFLLRPSAIFPFCEKMERFLRSILRSVTFHGGPFCGI